MLELLRSPFFVTKVVELALSIICSFLLAGILPSDTIFQIEVVHTTIFGFVLVNLVVVLAFFFEEPLSSRLAITISAVATAFHVVAAIIMFGYYLAETNVSRRILAAAFITLLDAVIFGADCFFTCRYIPE
ncbi:uncharacterized protein LOC135832094 [Planococcus citri]|uniref:uncharacterized protein LOC135832094 n=1 Tax=Planococcus citri TaxID=170843 RepID=UPI0031F9FF88